MDQLRGLPGAKDAEAAWAGAAAGPGYDCDATIVPIVTGHIDPAVLDRLAAALLRGRAAKTGQDSQNGPDSEADAARRRLAERAARQIVIAHAADLMSGPAGLAAYLRTGLLGGSAAAISLPLGTGAATKTVPAHLRRLVIARDRRCRFPGCTQPPAACQSHHILPRSKGGRTCLTKSYLVIGAQVSTDIRASGRPATAAWRTSPSRGRTPPAPAAPPAPASLWTRPRRRVRSGRGPGWRCMSGPLGWSR